ncbi:uncharacterized protein LOC127977053 [Carassius gibelio]|uniref:uncharacterized protein LOC127977053 n=1 Tax=Carassius gibelio TaxID=101364 RepID=UPI002277A307|nr:uncharacterized protein LOC127977053 [Carassius gibelio]
MQRRCRRRRRKQLKPRPTESGSWRLCKPCRSRGAILRSETSNRNGEDGKEEEEDIRTKLKETLKDGVVGSARLMNIRHSGAPDGDCAKRTVIGRRIARRTGEINRQTEARETESREEGSRASNQQSQVKAAQEKVAETPLHNLKPGDFVVVRDLRRKSWKAKRWLGPFQVLLTTHTAVKGAERAMWIQASHCRKVPPVSEEEELRE